MKLELPLYKYKRSATIGKQPSAKLGNRKSEMPSLETKLIANVGAKQN